MSEHAALLERELSGEEATFSFKLRFRGEWDPALFNRLIRAMYQIATDYKGEETVGKRLAAAFYFCATTLPAWSGHPSFEKRYAPEYYEYAYRLLDALNTYLFRDRDAIECGLSLGIDDAISRLDAYVA